MAFTASWLAQEMEINRKATTDFISTDPTEVALTPRTTVSKPGGGYEMVEEPVKVVQTFKLIPVGAGFNGITESDSGFERKYEFFLLGAYDADVAVGDYWVDATGQRWEVSGMVPFNGYEVKAGIYSFGRYPNNG